MTALRAIALFGLAVCGVGLSYGAAQDPPKKADAPLRPLSVRALAFSPDGKTLVAGAGMKAQTGAVVAWDVATRKELWRHRAAKGFPAVSFVPDGKSVAVVNWRPVALRFDAATGKELGEVGPHPAAVRGVAHIPGTDYLATGSDGTIRFWDLKTGKVGKELKGGHPAEVRDLYPSPDGKWLVSAGPDTTRIWDVAAGTELKDVLKQSQGIGYYGVAFVAPDRVLMSNNSAVQRITELPSGKEVLRFQNSGGYASQAYSPAAGLAAYCWGESTEAAVAELTFRPPTAAEKTKIERLLKEFDDDSYAVRVAASAEMRKVGSVAEAALRKAAADGPSAEVRMRAREARKAILDEPARRLVGHTGPINPLAFAPDGTVLATGADDGMVRLWNPRTGKELARLEVGEPAPKPKP